ncbi:transposase [Mesorhizobium sp. B2-1-1]|uniref:transposase n=1 Tax=unclassified Mesorhizobium TaxID=325217 RepID=UPI0015E42CAE|nr:transposase [Mesorhizobium sp. B2-1-1]
MTASATIATIGYGTAFSKGRDFGAWLGLVPKRLSTGDRTVLGGLASAAKGICARSSSSVRAPYWRSLRVGPSLALRDGRVLRPGGSITTSRLRHRPKARAVFGSRGPTASPPSAPRAADRRTSLRASPQQSRRVPVRLRRLPSAFSEWRMVLSSPGTCASSASAAATACSSPRSSHGRCGTSRCAW